MRIDPKIAALRSQAASQRTAQQALDAVHADWRDGAGAAVLQELAEYGAGRGLRECPALLETVQCRDSARALVGSLVSPMMTALSANPLAQVPLRYQVSPGLSMLQLGQSGRGILSLLVYEEFDQRPELASFSGGDRHEIVLEGTADVRRLDLLEERGGQAAIDQRVCRLTAGETTTCAGYTQTRLVERVHGRCAMLRLARTDLNPRATRQYRLDDGRRVHQASATREESQREMATALLGRFGRKDAAPVLAELAREGSSHIRWQTLRECLALNASIGFATLCEIAADPVDALAVPAGSLRAQLLETYPELGRLETVPCPA